MQTSSEICGEIIVSYREDQILLDRDYEKFICDRMDLFDGIA